MSAEDMNVWSQNVELVASTPPASPKCSAKNTEPDTPIVSYMDLLENSGPPSPLQTGEYGDSPHTRRYKTWYWRQCSLTVPLDEVLPVSSDEDVLVENSCLLAKEAVPERLSDQVPSEHALQATVAASTSWLPSFPSLHESEEWVRQFGHGVSLQNGSRSSSSTNPLPEIHSSANGPERACGAVQDEHSAEPASASTENLVTLLGKISCFG